MKYLVAIFIILISSELGKCIYTSGFQSKVKLSPNNQGDIYLVTSLMTALTAHSRCNATVQFEVQSPLGFLCQIYFVKNDNGVVYFWNRRSGRIFLILYEEAAERYLADIRRITQKTHLKLEIVFNEMLGVNNLGFTPFTYDFYSFFGNIFAEILGIGCRPSGLVNLLGLIVYRNDLPPQSCVINPETTPIKDLFDIADPRALAVAIGQCSILVDAAGYWNVRFVFQDCAFPITTKSGYVVGNLLGEKSLLVGVPRVLDKMISVMPPDSIARTLQHVLSSAAFDLPLRLPRLFARRGELPPPIDFAGPPPLDVPPPPPNQLPLLPRNSGGKKSKHFFGMGSRADGFVPPSVLHEVPQPQQTPSHGHNQGANNGENAQHASPPPPSPPPPPAPSQAPGPNSGTAPQHSAAHSKTENEAENSASQVVSAPPPATPSSPSVEAPPPTAEKRGEPPNANAEGKGHVNNKKNN